jgi:hypothetical protein
MKIQTVLAVACLGLLAVAAVPGAGFAQNTKPPTATAPTTGGPHDAAINTSRSNIRHPNEPVAQPTTGGPNDAAINTSRSNIRHPNLATQPTGGTTGPSPKAPSVMDAISTTR